MPELIMCVVGELNNAPYETFSHSPRFLAAGGTQAHLNALSDLPRAIEDTKLFDTQERAALRLTTEMTNNVRASAATFEEARLAMTDLTELVDLVGLIATYNVVSRSVVAFDIQVSDGQL
jgi:alkylhydroperoxidase family enzyme